MRWLDKLAAGLIGLVAFTSQSAYGAAIDTRSLQDGSSLLFKRQTPAFTPIRGFTRVVQRRSLNTLQNDFPDIFNMLILAWDNVARRAESNLLSFYQVAGIHGAPYITWQYPNGTIVNPGVGYCTHSSALFLTWHRPYLLLFEQELHDAAVSIAQNFTGSDAARYQAAADDVRVPYWDWASTAESTIPPAARQSTISVTRPGTGGAPTRETITNPLFAYRFLQRHPEFGVDRDTTIRDSAASTFDFGTVTRSSTYNAFTRNTDFNSYQSAAELPHNIVHTGVGGDMRTIVRSAFDPIFWLHHTNVDRLAAMFQAIRPGEDLTPAPRSPLATLQLPVSGTDDLQTPLYPFRNPNAEEWTSDQIRGAPSIFTYGYSYPEVPQGRTTSDLQAFTTREVNRLYGPGSGPALRSASFAANTSVVPQTPEAPEAAAATARREYSVNVLFKAVEAPGSIKILFYLGSGTDLAGQVSTLGDANQRPTGSRLTNYTAPLTTALVEKQIALKAEDAVPYLTRELRWEIERVTAPAGRIPASNIPSLQIAVVSSIVTYSESGAELPRLSDTMTHFAPTAGKDGGIESQAPPPIGIKAPASLDPSGAPGP